MKIPKYVQVGGFKFKVDKVDEIDLENSDGCCSIARALIEIKKGNEKQMEAQIFFHELVHAIGIIYCSDSLTEQQVEGVSQGLFQVAQDLKWIKE